MARDMLVLMSHCQPKIPTREKVLGLAELPEKERISQEMKLFMDELVRLLLRVC